MEPLRARPLRLDNYVDLRGRHGQGHVALPCRRRRPRHKQAPIERPRGTTQLDYTWLALRRLVRAAAPFNPTASEALARALASTDRQNPTPIPGARSSSTDALALEERLIEHLLRFYVSIDDAIASGELLWDALVGGGDIATELVSLDRMRSSPPQTAHDLGAALVLFRPFWLRSPATWPGGHPAALIEHLFIAYPVPRFLLNIWRNDARSIVARWLPWIIALGQGGSLRRLSKLARARGCPGPWPVLGKKLPAKLAEVPATLSPRSGMMHAEVLRLGGSVVECRRLRADDSYVLDPLVATPAQRQFWTGAVHWLRNHRDQLGDEDAAAILAWARHQQTERQRAEADPFEWAGRSVAATLREATHYQLELRISQRCRAQPRLSWARHGWDWNGEVDELRWTITELRRTEELVREGMVMHHCVHTYADHCAHNRSAIFSVRRAGQPRLTVEVRVKDRKVIQVRGRHNRAPNDGELRVLDRWRNEILGR